MGFLSLLEVASMPVIELLVVIVLGAFMATDYLNFLPSDARRYMNKIVFVAFTPSLLFGSLAKTVRFRDIISWWFMPVNIGITFLVGGFFGWVAVKIVRPKPYLHGLIMAMCSAGNLGNILLIIIPAICKETGSPFGDSNVCSTVGLSYVSFSMALGDIYIWTYTFYLIRSSREKYRAAQLESEESRKEPNKDIETDKTSILLHQSNHNTSLSNRVVVILHQLGEELLTPPILASVTGFVFGSVTWLQNLIIGESAPLRVINSSIQLLGNGTIPCVTLIMGGNLTQGLRKAKVKSGTVIAVICVRYVILPVVGICVVQMASWLGFLQSDPLYHFVLMIQFALPPAMSIGTISQLFDVAQEECSVLFFWTYLVAAIALTVWSTLFMWILN